VKKVFETVRAEVMGLIVLLVLVLCHAPLVYGACPDRVCVAAVEVTQAIQYMDYKEPLDQTKNNTVPLIEGKKTVVRVYVESAVPWNARRDLSVTFMGTLKGSHSGAVLSPDTVQPISPVDMKKVRGVTLRDKRKKLTQSLNFILPPDWTQLGKLEMSLQTGVQISPPVDPRGVFGDVTCPTCTRGPLLVEFHKSAPLKLKFIRLVEKVNGNISRATPTPAEFVEHIEYIRSWLKRAFPISPKDLRVKVEVWPDENVVDVLGLEPIEYDFIECQGALLATTDAREADRALEESRFDDGVQYIGLFGNDRRTDAGGMARYLNGCSFVDPQIRSNSIIAVPLGTPARWRLMSERGASHKTYADWYTGHELGHTFGLYHLPFAIGCEGNEPGWPNVPTCPRGDAPDGGYDPYFTGGLISPPDNTFFGFDVGDIINRVTLPMKPLPGDISHDMMTYSKYVWVSARNGIDGNGVSQGDRSYGWIRHKLIGGSTSGSTPPVASTGPAISERRMVHSSNDGRVFSAGADTTRPVVLIAETEGSGGVSTGSPAAGEQPVGRSGFLRVVVEVNLTTNRGEFRLVRRVEGAAASPMTKSGSAFVRLMGKGEDILGEPFPVVVMKNPDSLPGKDSIGLVAATIPLLPDEDLTQLDRLELVLELVVGSVVVATFEVSNEQLKSGKGLGSLVNPPKPKR